MTAPRQSSQAPAEPGEQQAPEQTAPDNAADPARPEEFGGRGGLDPTRYGDWEKDGRCIDF